MKKQLKVNMKMINRTSNNLNNIYKIILMIIVIFFILSSLICMFLFILPYNTNYIYDNNISKVVEIRCSNDNENWGYATGFFISNDGEILTNKHVVKNGDSNYTYIQIRLVSESNWINAKILNNSDSSDLAMLKVNITGTNFFKMANDVSNGEKIYTFGNPNGYGLSFLEGVVSSSRRVVDIYGVSYNMMQTSFVINPGNSGGPVFDINNKLLGIISFRLKDTSGEVIQGVSFAVHVDDIRKFVESIIK